MKKVNSDIAYDYIRKRILNGDFTPGRSLVTEELSVAIGVSRTPVRDALRQLEADGLVTIQPRLGASVKRLNLEDYQEMCDLRLALESHCAAMAALKRGEADLREMHFALEAMRDLTDKMISAGNEEPFLREMIGADVRFHIAIITAARNALFKREILRVHLINRLVPGLDERNENSKLGGTAFAAHRRAVQASHADIYDAIFQSDAPRARAAMEKHIQEIIDQGLSSMRSMEKGEGLRRLTAEELAYGPVLQKKNGSGID